MVNEDIVTVLRNAVNNGEPLPHAVQILINSGYDATQVEEASKYVQGGTMQNLQPKPDEHLIMAQNKNIFNRNQPTTIQNQQQQPNLQLQQQRTQIQQNMQQAINTKQQPKFTQQQPINTSDQIQNIKPPDQKNLYGQQYMNMNEINQLSQPVQQQNQMVQENIQQPRDFQNNNQQVKPTEIKLKKKSHKKEIILMIILLFLISVLATTIFFREKLLTFLSG